MPNQHKPTSAVFTLPDPDKCPSAIHVEEGGTIQWRNDSPNYPDFVIEIIRADPPSGSLNGAKFAGNNSTPVVITVPFTEATTAAAARPNTAAKATTTYTYTFTQIPTKGTPTVSVEHILYVTGCPYCDNPKLG